MEIIILLIIVFIGSFLIVYHGSSLIEKLKIHILKPTLNESSTVENTTNETEGQQPTYMPYTHRPLFTKTEQLFFAILVSEARKRDLIVCPKVRLEDIVNVTDKQNRNKYRGYIKSRHVDFVLLNSSCETVAAIELDDPSHETKKAMQVDKFKDKLFYAIRIPLIRIYVGNNYTREINNAFNILQIPIPETSEANE